jgi:hypothetical protein
MWLLQQHHPPESNVYARPCVSWPMLIDHRPTHTGRELAGNQNPGKRETRNIAGLPPDTDNRSDKNRIGWL